MSEVVSHRRICGSIGGLIKEKIILSFERADLPLFKVTILVYKIFKNINSMTSYTHSC